jgi:hypothetical protein
MIALIDRTERVPDDDGPMLIDCDDIDFGIKRRDFRKLGGHAHFVGFNGVRQVLRSDGRAVSPQELNIYDHELVCFAYSVDDSGRAQHQQDKIEELLTRTSGSVV